MISMGKRELQMGGTYLTELRRSDDIVDNFQALRERLQEDGYLYIPNFHDRETVLNARMDIFKVLDKLGNLDPNAPLHEGRIGSENKTPNLFGAGEDHKKDFPNVHKVVNSPEAMKFFDGLFGEPSMTLDHKWLRATTSGYFTEYHYDVFYVGRVNPNVYTMWTPFSDLPMEMGPLAICLDSHRLEELKATYGKKQWKVEEGEDYTEGLFGSDPVEFVDKYGGCWASDNLKAGDALIFGMYMMHGSLDNNTDFFRISSDTRYQRSSEPFDPLFHGEKVRSEYKSFYRDE